MTLKKDIETAREFCLKSLDKLTKKVESNEEIEQIATISSADPKVGKMVAEAIDKVGKDGVITVEEGNGFETTVDFKDGMEIDRGYMSPYFVTDQQRVEAVIESPYILITDKKINHNYELVPFVENFLKTDRKLVIFAAEMMDEALSTLVINRMRGVLEVLVVQAPAFGGRRVDELEDLAILTGGTLISQDSGRSLESVTIEELGRCDKIISDRDKTILINGWGNKEAVENRMNNIREQIKIGNTDYDKDIKRQRLAKMAGGVAVINVGANSEVEMREKKERIIDAVNATKAAIEAGVVAGGEITLLKISQEAFWKDLGTTGANILREALKRPFKRLVENAGYDYAEIWGKMQSVKYPNGVDVETGEIKDLIKEGILDPAKVTKSALENAISVALMCMTTSTLITDYPEDEK